MSQLEGLSKPLPDRFIQKNPSGGGVYVTHSVITQKLLATVGPFDFSLVEIVRGDLAGKAANPSASSKRGKEGTPDLTNAIVGAVCRITVEIDGRLTSVEEVGDCEDPYNWPHDGARLKDAMSDALKRCAMRLGLGLHLWSKEPGDYVLYAALSSKSANNGANAGALASGLTDAEPGTVEVAGATEEEPPQPTPTAYPDAVTDAIGETVTVEPGESKEIRIAPGKISNAQRIDLMQTCQRKGIKDEERKHLASDAIGRTLESFNDLTTAEANKVAKALSQLPDDVAGKIAEAFPGTVEATA